MTDFFTNPIVVALIVGLPSTAVAVASLVRSRRVDKVAEQAGAATQKVGEVNSTIAGLNTLVENLQEDNKQLRLEVAELRARTKELSTSWEILQAEVLRLNEVYRSAVAKDAE